MMDLKSQQCEPCHSDNVSPLKPEEYAQYLKDLEGWSINRVDGVDRLVKSYTFDNFRDAMAFAVAVGDIAEEVEHHPVMEVTWGKVTLSWWTHNINGLHLNDFIMAARCADLYK